MISLDTSSTCTGYAVFENGQYARSGIIIPDSNPPNGDRCFSIGKKLLKFCDLEKPDIIAIEQLVSMRNANTTRILAKLIGVVYSWHLRHPKSLYVEIPPSRWRGELGIQKRAKRDELKSLSKKYVLDSEHVSVSDDEADAICIGLSYIKMMEGATK